ncbi:MAG: hypothetical protein P8X39_01705 [Desulfofustis sp.]
MAYATTGPREVITEHRRLPLDIPEGVAPTEFYNSPCNLRHLARENGLLRNQLGFLLYRKAIGHSNLFDASIIYDTSQRVLDPMGRPVRRDQLSRDEKIVFSRMTKVVLQYMLERYPDPEKHLLFCGEASLDATWPLNKPGVPSVRMIHNHFMVFENRTLAQSDLAAADNPNLTDSGHNGLLGTAELGNKGRSRNAERWEILERVRPGAARLSRFLPSFFLYGCGRGQPCSAGRRISRSDRKYPALQ